MGDAKTDNTAKKPLAKQVRYNKKVANKIYALLREGVSVDKLCARKDMPSKSNFYMWRNKYKEFRDKAHQAKIDGCFAIVDEALDIADDASKDWTDVVTKDGEVKRVIDREVVARSKLRIDTRIWLAAKMLPKVFGEKIEVEHSVDDSLAAMLKAGRERVHNRE